MLSHDAESNKVRTPKTIINNSSTHFTAKIWEQTYKGASIILNYVSLGSQT